MTPAVMPEHMLLIGITSFSLDGRSCDDEPCAQQCTESTRNVNPVPYGSTRRDRRLRRCLFASGWGVCWTEARVAMTGDPNRPSVRVAATKRKVVGIGLPAR